MVNSFSENSTFALVPLKSYRLIGKMLEVKFEDGFGEVIEVGNYYDWIKSVREENRCIRY